MFFLWKMRRGQGCGGWGVWGQAFNLVDVLDILIFPARGEGRGVRGRAGRGVSGELENGGGGGNFFNIFFGAEMSTKLRSRQVNAHAFVKDTLRQTTLEFLPELSWQEGLNTPSLQIFEVMLYRETGHFTLQQLFFLEVILALHYIIFTAKKKRSAQIISLYITLS